MFSKNQLVLSLRQALTSVGSDRVSLSSAVAQQSISSVPATPQGHPLALGM